MPIRVVCKHCGKQFSAWDDLIGKAVKCPKCQQEMVVHSGNDALGQPPAPAPPLPTRPAAAPPVTPKPVTPKPVTPRPVAPPMPAIPGRPVPPSPKGRPANAADDFDDSEELPYACPHCHQSMPADEDLCDHCGYHRVLKRRIDISEGVNKPDKSVGFERLFKGQLADASSAESTLLLIKVVGGTIAAGVLFLCLGWWSVIPVAIAAAVFVYWKKKRSPTAGDDDPSEVNRDVASTFMWTLTLNFQRAVGWRIPAWPFPTTKALTLHDSTFTDQDLADIEDLAKYESLDLEGTQLSNAGLEQLQTMKQLRNIVVRRTNVTVAGVQRLQQALPKASIWF
jgi:DNA-directed RNA polymerase subunit RPC12/RpoP